MAVDCTVLGMPLIGDHDIAQPLGALVIIKGLDEAGKVCHWARCTDDISTVEAVGMATMALDTLRDALRGDPP